jgi:hypothetical protein
MAGLTPADLRVQTKINNLDLTTIVKVTRKQEAWTAKQATDADLWYRRFLLLCHVNRLRSIAVLGREADKIWHNHILDTVRYQADCKSVFGAYLNHRPIVGRQTAAQTVAIQKTTAQCLSLFGTLPYFGGLPDIHWPCLH